MSTVNFKINSKNYSVDCGAGQENQILAIAEQIDSKAKNLSSMFGDVDNETLLLMVCILAFGDISKAKSKVANLEKQVARLQEEALDEDVVANIIAQITTKIKTLSASLSSNTKPTQNTVRDTIIDFKF
ncbi:MAG: cell division protein ZapA [Alphaproteobacteria bacterium]|nr:cell division protein ZapA [Alphaproteobacteria bacterium]